MKIDDNHLYHGAALIQVAEDNRFTSINYLNINNTARKNAYLINDKIALFMKYSSKKEGSLNEYIFNFKEEHLEDIYNVSRIYPKTFIALVCIEDREICCVSYDELDPLILIRRIKKGSKEMQYNIFVMANHGQSFRVYIRSPVAKMTNILPFIVKRNAFPLKIFS